MQCTFFYMIIARQRQHFVMNRRFELNRHSVSGQYQMIENKRCDRFIVFYIPYQVSFSCVQHKSNMNKASIILANSGSFVLLYHFSWWHSHISRGRSTQFPTMPISTISHNGSSGKYIFEISKRKKRWAVPLIFHNGQFNMRFVISFRELSSMTFKKEKLNGYRKRETVHGSVFIDSASTFENCLGYPRSY